MGGADLARALKVFNEHFGELAGKDILLSEILYSLLGLIVNIFIYLSHGKDKCSRYDLLFYLFLSVSY